MYNRVDIDLIIARDKQRDLLWQAERERLIRLARAGSKTRAKADPRALNRLACWLRQLRLERGTGRCSRSAGHDPYLLVALAWMVAKE